MDNTMLHTSQHTTGGTSQFKFELLKQITNNFSEDRIIGDGTYGVVYKGIMDNGETIAIKKLKYMPPDHDSEKQFHNECTNLMRVQHQNIVRLVGYCDETHRRIVKYDGEYVVADENEKALCFEYLQGGSLDKHVSDEPCRLDWDTCYKIIKGVCVGLNHLYKESIFHFDLKPANILLDENIIPKIGDFGLSRFFSTTGTCTTTTPLGTRGYTPPEYVDKQEISPKYDVFSLGVVIIHIMAGRKHYYDHVDNPSKIIELACENWRKRLHATMWSHASQEVKTCIEIALTCVESDRRKRLTISQIVDELNRIDIEKLSLTHEATNLQSREALDRNQCTNSVWMGVHENSTRFDSVVGIDYIAAVSGEVGGDDRLMHGPMDYVDRSIIRDSAFCALGGHASRAISEHPDVTQTTKVDVLDDGHLRRNSHLRVDGNPRTSATVGIMGTIAVTSGSKLCDNLFQWARSTISTQSSGTERQRLHQELFCLESGLQYLMDTLPAMYDLIDRSEWRSHKNCVAELLPNLKDVVYDADDLLDEFRWYMLNMKVVGNGSESLSMDFFNGVIQGSFIKLVNGIRDRMHNIATCLENTGLHEVSTRFDKSVRPETTSFPSEINFIGREMELRKIIGFLCMPRNSSKRQKVKSSVDVSTSTSVSNQVSSQSSKTDLPVLPIVGIGGVGKATLAQHVCRDVKVKNHFDEVIWVCVSDDFNVKRLTKEAIESCTGIQAMTENLNSLQNVLSKIVISKKFLIVLDDLWDDVLKENGQSWERFCAPFKDVVHECVMLVTTRSQKVADRVGTRYPLTLEGLEHDVFWDFFKLCVFEPGSSNNNDPELVRIGRSIVPKLKGSPLAAKTLGRILKMNLQAEHWNTILESELWTLKQEETEILPALRLSYMYLPFHLKRCFSLCALYPKDYKFQKGHLAEIWVAEGFVEPQGNIPVKDIGVGYFIDLLDRSFFQEVQSGYVIHDLLHDMAQKVSEFDCFIIKGRSDFKSIPRNVRHLSILSNTDVDYSNLLGLRHFTKLRTLICDKPLEDKRTPSLLAVWCSEFLRLRVIIFPSTHELPSGIGNLKHLRYLQISRDCPFKSLPVELYWLYNLQFLYIPQCKLESLPSDFNKLICLQRFASYGFRCDSVFRRFQKDYYYKVHVDVANDEQGIAFRLIQNINQLGELVIYNISKPISKEHAAEAQLQNKKHLEKLNLEWSLLRNLDDSNIEVLRFLQPPTCLKSLLLQGYPGVSLTSLFHPQNLPNLMSPSLISSDGLESSSLASITDLVIDGWVNLSSLEHVIHPGYIPFLKKLTINNCKKLLSVPAERFGALCCLKELEIQGCPNIYSKSLVAPSLKRLVLGKKTDWNCDSNCGNLANNIFDCCSLTYFFWSCNDLTSIQLKKWNLPALEELHISECRHLTSIIGQSGQVIRGTSGIRAFPSLGSLTIEACYKLSTIDDLLAEEYLPAIKRIHVLHCFGLVSLPGERFGNFSSLKELEISYCNRLSWRRGFVLPTSLQILSLCYCGDISACVPSCLQNLASLVRLIIRECRCITSIPGNLWSTNLTSLENLVIWDCANIVSIGGESAISEVKNVRIDRCPKLEELEQPMLRGHTIPFVSREWSHSSSMLLIESMTSCREKSELLAESTLRHERPYWESYSIRRPYLR